MDAPWIDWAGGECPLPPDTIVDVKFRDGATDEGAPAGWWDWGNSVLLLAEFDIVAYRVVTE